MKIVPCETYIQLIKKWNRRTFLIQENTITQFKQRHFDDSLQLINYIPNGAKILDVGSGAGFPGMVLASTGLYDVSLCESNAKKCIFLREVSRETGVDVEIINRRVENLEKGTYSHMTARGFTSLIGLIELMKHLDIKFGVFLKGRNIKGEIDCANKEYDFEYQLYDSKTSEDGKIVIVKLRG